MGRNVFRRGRRDHVPPGGGERGPGRSFTTRLPSADPALAFEARVTYWSWQDETAGVLLDGDAVARSLVREAAVGVSVRFPVLDVLDAEAAVNNRLADGAGPDPRLRLTAVAALSVTEKTRAAAALRAEAARGERVRMAAEVARLEALRELLLDRRLGPVWWVDRHADAQFAVGDPEAKTRSVLGAFALITAALRADEARAAPDEGAVIRAQVEELLGGLRDPATGSRVAELLQTILQVLVPKAGEAAVDGRRDAE